MGHDISRRAELGVRVQAMRENHNSDKRYTMNIPEMVDITSPRTVQVQIRSDGKVIWINVDGMCRLRCCQIEHLDVEDDRKPSAIKLLKETLEAWESLPGPRHYRIQEWLTERMTPAINKVRKFLNKEET